MVEHLGGTGVPRAARPGRLAAKSTANAVGAHERLHGVRVRLGSRCSNGCAEGGDVDVVPAAASAARRARSAGVEEGLVRLEVHDDVGAESVASGLGAAIGARDVVGPGAEHLPAVGADGRLDPVVVGEHDDLRVAGSREGALLGVLDEVLPRLGEEHLAGQAGASRTARGSGRRRRAVALRIAIRRAGRRAGRTGARGDRAHGASGRA